MMKDTKQGIKVRNDGIMAAQVWYDEHWRGLGKNVEGQDWRNHSKEHKSLNITLTNLVYVSFKTNQMFVIL